MTMHRMHVNKKHIRHPLVDEWPNNISCRARAFVLQETHQDMRYPNVTWHRLISLPLLRLTPPTEGFSWNDLRKILYRRQGTAKVQSGEEILPKISTHWLGRTNVTDDRRQTDLQ